MLVWVGGLGGGCLRGGCHDCRIGGWALLGIGRWVLLASDGHEEGSIDEHDELRALAGDSDTSSKITIENG
jgi:hypothetical protein